MRRLIFGLLVLGIAIPALAQQPPGLTWVRYYEAAPGKEREFAQLLIASSKPVFDQLIADKQVVAWGVAVPMTHYGETWTHVVYVTAPSWSSFDALMAAAEAAMAKLSPADAKKLDEQLTAAQKPRSLRDVVLRHVSQAPLPTTPPAVKPKYIGVDTYVIKQGRFEDAVGLFNEWAKPILTKVASGGKINHWGFSTQELVKLPEWTHMFWYFITDLGAIDEMNAGIMALEPMKLKGYDVRLRDLSEPDKHQGQLLRIVYQAP